MKMHVEVETITNTDGYIIPVKMIMENDEQTNETYKIVGINLRNRTPDKTLIYEVRVSRSDSVFPSHG